MSSFLVVSHPRLGIMPPVIRPRWRHSRAKPCSVSFEFDIWCLRFQQWSLVLHIKPKFCNFSSSTVYRWVVGAESHLWYEQSVLAVGSAEKWRWNYTRNRRLSTNQYSATCMVTAHVFLAKLSSGWLRQKVRLFTGLTLNYQMCKRTVVLSQSGY